MKIGIFGAGRMATDHAMNVSNSRIASLEWVVDPNQDAAKKLASEYSCDFFSTWQEAVERKKVDAFVIVSSSATHMELIKNLAPFKLPIFCEKPIAIDTNQVRSAQAVIQEYQVPFLLGFNRRYDSNFAELKKRIGEIFFPVE